MSTEIIPRASIVELIGHRDRALEQFKMAAAAMNHAEASFIKAAPSCKYGSDLTITESSRNRGFRIGRDEPHDLIETYRRRLDAAVWRHLLAVSQIGDLMDRQAREDFNKQLEKDPPECTVENCAAKMVRLFGDSEIIFARSVAYAFEQLSRYHRTNDGFKIGNKAIFGGAISVWSHNHWSWNHRAGVNETIRDLDKAMHQLDGKAAPDYDTGIAGAIDRAFQQKQQTAESDYFHAKWHKNGTLHLTFKRADLLERANQMIAKAKGATVGAAPSARNGPAGH